MAAAIIPDYIDDYVVRSSDDKHCLVRPKKPVKIGSRMIDHLYLDLTRPGPGDDGHYAIISEDGEIIVFEISTLQIIEGETVHELKLVNGTPATAELGAVRNPQSSECAPIGLLAL